MSNIAGALYRVSKIANEMKCSRRIVWCSRRMKYADGVSVGRVSSNGSKPGVGGKISAEPNTL